MGRGDAGRGDAGRGDDAETNIARDCPWLIWAVTFGVWFLVAFAATLTGSRMARSGA